MIISKEDKAILEEAINLPNIGFGKALMSIAEKYQLFSEEDLSFLTNRQESKRVFLSDYAMLRLINDPSKIKQEVKDDAGYNRYYPEGYQFCGRTYAFTSQLYGYGGRGTHKNNRDPYYEWFLKKAGVTGENKDGWWPSEEEYDPGFDKQKWLELLNNPGVIGPVWGGTLAMFFDYGGEATCTQLGQRYKKDPASIRSSATQLAKRIHDNTGCPLFSKNEKEKYWTILFQGRRAVDNEKGSWVWKLRPELYEALAEFDIGRFLPSKKDKETEMTTKEILVQIKNYISGKGFTYDAGLVENFYLCLKSKPFVILAGTSGTGKTRLVKLFAEAIGAKYRMVSVRPDWSDGSDLFGHYDLNGNFIEGPVCKAFDAAVDDPSQPIMLCIDEMNLARVEYYLSDFLSVIESRDRSEDGKIITEPIAQYKGGIPDNLYIVGTVNMDETTFPFSKKVLDRANTIEFNYVDLIPDFGSIESEEEPLQIKNSFLCTDYLTLAQDCIDEKEYVVKICDELQKINEILKSANAHVGYRVRDEIVFYMLNNKNAEYLVTDDQAMDNEIMQKILPRIQGSSATVKDMLAELFKFCMGYYSGLDLDSGKTGAQMQAMSHAAIYPKSADKLGYMMTRFEEDGFTSYWL